ncbi:hypothetical protein EJB05_13649 [Eragrostis curvula]|uniref:Uncharacterized protein n=1 Tax=Eragrostis curvula TaxID=38414 RepID=A0A5J9VW85_9POAL|nr:hypothetical protein EJB05_13649 [Eragrostis curvula]
MVDHPLCIVSLLQCSQLFSVFVSLQSSDCFAAATVCSRSCSETNRLISSAAATVFAVISSAAATVNRLLRSEANRL